MPITHLALQQPKGTSPGPWSVVPDPWSRTGTEIVGENKLGGPSGDPHVSPLVAHAGSVLGCPDCEEGNHEEDVHRADARLIAAAPELYDLVIRQLRATARLYGDDIESSKDPDAEWARKAAKIVADVMPQKMTLTSRGYVYPRSLSIREILHMERADE